MSWTDVAWIATVAAVFVLAGGVAWLIRQVQALQVWKHTHQRFTHN